MPRRSLAEHPCPISRSVERVGAWWNILILREALNGSTRFDDFQQRLGIAPAMLTKRLRELVEEGLLTKARYCDRPPRDAYLLTERGRDFQPVLVALLAWGNRHFAPEGASVILADRATGEAAEPLLVDARSGKAIGPDTHRFAAGPAASEAILARYAPLGVKEA